MERFEVPNDEAIKKRYAKGTSVNCGHWYILKALEVISAQLDQLSKKFDQVLSPGDPENKQKIRQGCRLKAVSSRVTAWIRT